ncbi:MAG: DNA-binding protein WhiA [Lactobacillales bacterium]|jgi:DNA-binding protein WhiA|nr:DNA-binding protein WhiA [Lactobacillales bacterium]
MSYAADVKKELTTIEVHREHAKAELAALIKMNGALSVSNGRFNLNIQSENSAIARRIFTLLKEYFGVTSELLVRKKMKLKKNNVYIVRIRYYVNDLLNELDIMDSMTLDTGISDEIRLNPQKMRSYLRGAFLASGSINNPENANYHLEIYSLYETHNEDIIELMNHFNLNARGVKRKNGYIAYIKSAEAISEFLIVIGATNAMLKFEDIRIVRDFRNSTNRLINCETANMNKTADAAKKQIAAIEKIKNTCSLESLSEKLQELANLRLENPEMSMQELAEEIGISKSATNHRMKSILEFSEEI